MLAWAYRYLAMVVVLGIGFAMFADADPWRSGRPDGSGAHERHARLTQDEDAAVPLEMIIPAGPHGHFTLEAVVNGTPLEFVVDTGATDVVLSPDDAERIGLRREDLRFTRRYRTANGEVAAAPVRLRELRIGQFSAYDVEAAVNGAPLPVSLLGMSFLSQLRGYEVDDGRLILRW